MTAKTTIGPKLTPAQRLAGDQALARALRNAIKGGHVAVALYEDGVEISGPYDTVLVFLSRRFESPTALARFLRIHKSFVTDQRETGQTDKSRRLPNPYASDGR
ncbi:hypothetical protein ABZX75_17490 [Streptomyces sp. NPDC003038]|uniref:hypothetical protein n=1 Tax=unclassified Streptomyces TaxID=2593676 RepID=UPI0033BEA56F